MSAFNQKTTSCWITKHCLGGISLAWEGLHGLAHRTPAVWSRELLTCCKSAKGTGSLAST